MWLNSGLNWELSNFTNVQIKHSPMFPVWSQGEGKYAGIIQSTAGQMVISAISSLPSLPLTKEVSTNPNPSIRWAKLQFSSRKWLLSQRVQF
jgi:hypothetical protein